VQSAYSGVIEDAHKTVETCTIAIDLHNFEDDSDDNSENSSDDDDGEWVEHVALFVQPSRALRHAPLQVQYQQQSSMKWQITSFIALMVSFGFFAWAFL
jgi:hypothetical protein